MYRVGLLAAIALAVGCFDELPAPPGATEVGSTGSPGSTGAATAAATNATDDEDTLATTTSGGPAAEGLFACEKPAPCGPWDCSGGCPTIDTTAKCVLAALRDRSVEPLVVTRCDGECREFRVFPRGGGSDEVLIQSRTVAAPIGYSEVQRCILKPPEQFAGCLTQYDASCSDPATWGDMCEAYQALCL